MKVLTYIFKFGYLLLSWFVVAYTCYGELNVNLVCISVFIYSGGIFFDSVFYYFDAKNTNTILRLPIIILSVISLFFNLVIASLSVFCIPFITIPFDQDLNKYFIIFNNTIENGIAILYPEFAELSLDLSKAMNYIMVAGVFSLIPAILLELDSYIRIINDRYNKK